MSRAGCKVVSHDVGPPIMHASSNNRRRPPYKKNWGETFGEYTSPGLCAEECDHFFLQAHTHFEPTRYFLSLTLVLP